MKRTFAFVLLAILVAAADAAGGEGGKRLLIHARTSLKQDAAQTYAVPGMALAALDRGYKVAVLFDASGVTAIRIGAWYGGDTTPLDKAKLPDGERRSLSGRLGLPLGSIPDNYGDYIRFLKGKGVELYASREMMLRFRIGDDEYDTAVTPVGPERMLEILADADVYVAY